MAKKQDAYYFDTFIACLDDACRAAQLLDRSMRDFTPSRIKEDLDEMHAIEHSADDKKHELLNVLAKAFITPIEREDIMLLSQNIDEVTDKIEDVLLRVYCNNVQKIRPEALELSRLVIRCCEEAKLMAQYELAFDPSTIEERVTADGSMVKPQASQIYTLDLSEADSVVHYDTEETAGTGGGLLDALGALAEELLSYLP